MSGPSRRELNNAKQKLRLLRDETRKNFNGGIRHLNTAIRTIEKEIKSASLRRRRTLEKELTKANRALLDVKRLKTKSQEQFRKLLREIEIDLRGLS